MKTKITGKKFVWFICFCAFLVGSVFAVLLTYDLQDAKQQMNEMYTQEEVNERQQEYIDQQEEDKATIEDLKDQLQNAEGSGIGNIASLQESLSSTKLIFKTTDEEYMYLNTETSISFTDGGQITNFSRTGGRNDDIYVYDYGSVFSRLWKIDETAKAFTKEMELQGITNFNFPDVNIEYGVYVYEGRNLESKIVVGIYDKQAGTQLEVGSGYENCDVECVDNVFTITTSGMNTDTGFYGSTVYQYNCETKELSTVSKSDGVVASHEFAAVNGITYKITIGRVAPQVEFEMMMCNIYTVEAGVSNMVVGREIVLIPFTQTATINITEDSGAESFSFSVTAVNTDGRKEVRNFMFDGIEILEC